MGFEQVKSVVLVEAEAEAHSIIEKARKECEMITEDIRKEFEKILDEAIQKAEQREMQETARQLSVVRHEGRLEILETKNKVIDDIFKKAREVFMSMPDDEYNSLISGWLRKLPHDIGGTIRVSAIDMDRLPKNFLKIINSDRPMSGTFNSLESDTHIQNGCIVIGENFTMDLTIDKKLEELRESLAGELAGELFGI